MRLVLFRHGPAETRDATRWPDDSARPLTTAGADRTRQAARGVARLEPNIARVYSSPALRALDTARILSKELDLGAEPELLPTLSPDGTWRAVLERLRGEPADATVALVGHNPGMSHLAAGLLLAAGEGALMFKKAGACSITCEVPEPGRGRLRWWLRPAALRAVKPFKNGRVA
jgi:phosphohistidine phosphatase